MSDTRRDEEAIAWAAQVTGGTVVRREKQSRWRPQWILDIDTSDTQPKRVLLRGFRNPGYTEIDESGARGFLEREAQMLEALQPVPVKLPRYYGHDRELGWMLMEFVDGDTELTRVDDADRRFDIYTKYIEQIAQLHAWPLDKIKLPPGVERPASCREFKNGLRDRNTSFYRLMPRKHPEPAMELGLQWVANNELPDERPPCIGLVDTGPNQFLFKERDVTAMIDVEYAMVCDPLMEMGMMRGRDITYHTGRMPEHIRHYGKCYEELTGIPLSLESLQYWTIAASALWCVFTVAGTQKPNPLMVDMAFLFSYEVQQKRMFLEGLAEKYGIALPAPEFPTEQSSTLGVLHALMEQQFEKYYSPRSTDADGMAFAKYSAAIARTLARGNHCHLKIEGDNLDELGAILGSRVADLATGMFGLEQEIAKDHMRDLEKRLQFLHRFEVRREFFYEPMQVASGVSHGHLMGRMNEV